MYIFINFRLWYRNNFGRLINRNIIITPSTRRAWCCGQPGQSCWTGARSCRSCACACPLAHTQHPHQVIITIYFYSLVYWALVLRWWIPTCSIELGQTRPGQARPIPTASLLYYSIMASTGSSTQSLLFKINDDYIAHLACLLPSQPVRICNN